MSKTIFSTKQTKSVKGVSLSVTDEFVLNFLEGIDSPRALTVWLLYISGEHLQLVSLDCDPLSYTDGLAFRDDYAATLLLRKAQFLKTGLDLEDVAKKKFLAAEEQCRVTNHRFRTLESQSQYSSETASVLFTASRKISSVLGAFCPEELVNCSNWGPGATSSLKSRDTSRPNKFWKDSGTTPKCATFIEPWFAEAYPLWSESLNGFSVIKGSSILYVPKDARTHRVIAKEPGINSWFQKGVGKMIRRRLKYRAGIDLDSQKINQSLAKLGSQGSGDATVDFSSASDTIATEAVRFLLQWSPDWFSVMDVFRSHVGTLGESEVRWQKFSSMGNGFTFELESLIFWAIAYACCEVCKCDPERVSVFGDDVIIPEEALPLFRSVVEFCGFTINTKKSFSSGYFRESCGVHYWNGFDCQPYFLRKEITDVHAAYKAANAVKALGHRRNYLFDIRGCDVRFYRCFADLYRRVHKSYRFCVPYGIGDCGFVSEWDEAVPTLSRPKDGWEGYYVKAWVTKAIQQQVDHPGLLLTRLWDRSVENGWGNSYSLRDQTRYVVRRILVHEWSGLGPWIKIPRGLKAFV